MPQLSTRLAGLTEPEMRASAVRHFFALAVAGALLSGCAGASSSYDGMFAKKAPSRPQVQQTAAATPPDPLFDSAAQSEDIQNDIVAANEPTPEAINQRIVSASLPDVLPQNSASASNAPAGNDAPAPREIQVASNQSQPAQITEAPVSLMQRMASYGQVNSDQENSNPANNPISALALLENDLPGPGMTIGTVSTPQIDPVEFAAQQRIATLQSSIRHGSCKSAWSPRPKRLEAKRINPGDPYYVEFRMRNTPLMPVGHTFVVYGKLDGNGEPLDEKIPDGA